MVDSPADKVSNRNAKLFSSSATIAAIPLFIVLFCTVLFTFDTESVATGEHTLKDYSRLTRKVVEFNKSSRNPDVLLIGSSLSLTPVIRADKGGFPEIAGIGRKLMTHDYNKCSYLENEMQNLSSQKKEIFNLSLPGTMISDFYVTLHSAMENGKRPKTVILALAPRDFASNVKQDYRTSYAYKTLESFDDVNGTWLTRFPMGRSLLEARNFVERSILLFRSQTTQLLCDATSQILLPTGLPPASEEGKEEELTASECDQRVVNVYRTHFNPPNFKLLKIQTAYLDAIMKLGERYGFETVVIDMPTRSDMQGIIRPDLLASYKENLRSTCRSHHCRLLDGEKLCVLKDSDFVDIVHLDTDGARAFLRQVARRLTIAKTDDVQL